VSHRHPNNSFNRRKQTFASRLSSILHLALLAPFDDNMSTPSSSSVISKADIRHLYKRLLRACQKYPSKNRASIYQSIREEFRDNVTSTGDAAQRQLHLAYKGLSQLHQYDSRHGSTSFAVQLEQNPFPKPQNYTTDKRTTERVEQMLRQQVEKEKEK
jgi:Complex 1 protein (LYR family)